MRTPCGRFIGTRSYSLSWAPTFRGRLALPCCVLIISQTLRFVKTFFRKSLLAVGLEPTSSALPTLPKTPATDGRTRLERVGWLSGRLPATDAHHLCFFCQVLYFSEKILGENLVAVFPIEWVLDASAYHSCGTGKGFSVGCPSHSRCFRLPTQRMQLLSSLCT